MHLRSVKQAPVTITLCVLLLVCLVHALPAWLQKEDAQEAPRFDFFQRLEWMTYDARVRWALRFPRPYASNLLGAVFIDDRDLTALNDGSYGYRVKFPWPRYFFGRAVNELAAQGASLAGLDIFFDQTDPDTIVEGPGRRRVPSDQYLADQLRKASNVVLAADAKRPIFPAPLFETNAFAVGNVYTKVDSDGILRKARAFVERRTWHPAIVRMARALNWDLGRVQMQPDRFVFNRSDSQPPDYVPLTRDGALKFDADGELIVNRDGSGESSTASATTSSPGTKPYTDTKVWQLGIILAAHHLGLNLNHPVIERDRIILRGKGQERIIPVDRDGFFYVDWAIKLSDTNRLESESIVRLIRQSEAREEGQADFEPKFRGKLVVIGSIGTGGNVSDHGATPLENETVLVSKHWNVANSVIMGHFINRASLGTELLLIGLFGLVSGVLSWTLRVYLATTSVLLVSLAYSALAVAVYVQSRYWLPLFMPVVGGLLLPHFALITYRVVFEERERDRVKAVFEKIVSPDVVSELLGAERLSLGGARRRLTVLFADVRGFTEFTDISQANAEESARQRRLTGKEAEDHFDEQAREALTTVSLYLSVIADTVKKHHGTLDKYIGDCVMAFWGAPAVNDQHALCCVRAAIEAQRTMYSVNKQRFAENKRREEENAKRVTTGLPLLPMLPLLSVGCGINSGKMTVGLMGSDAHIVNYTVFGREVNVASRLEKIAGRGGIIISEATFAGLQQADPSLAATCLERPPVQVKGIREPVKIYEVPWKQEPVTALAGSKSS
ncbi:MAG: adenylate/guanylate cyclase domain-containing protein [Verrucomicrobia bacterium]|nr:adenylate/guanylate cyclase domain-containing protein [Verrucomicrobiota bacterium]